MAGDLCTAENKMANERLVMRSWVFCAVLVFGQVCRDRPMRRFATTLLQQMAAVVVQAPWTVAPLRRPVGGNEQGKRLAMKYSACLVSRSKRAWPMRVTWLPFPS